MPTILTPRAFARALLVAALAGLFLIGGIGNLVAPPEIAEQYAR